MAKFKAPKGKRANRLVPQAALPCVVFIAAGIVLFLLFLYIVMRSMGQS